MLDSLINELVKHLSAGARRCQGREQHPPAGEPVKSLKEIENCRDSRTFRYRASSRTRSMAELVG
jgi:hypothetical protein